MPTAVFTYTVDLEIEYNSFNGKTLEEYADLVQDDLEDCLWDVRDTVLESVSTAKVKAEIKA